MAKSVKYNILTFTTETEGTVRANVRESVRFITKVKNSAQKISKKYNKPAWEIAANAIEERLRNEHRYIKFLLSDPEARKFHDKTYNDFTIFCTKKIIKGA